MKWCGGRTRANPVLHARLNCKSSLQYYGITLKEVFWSRAAAWLTHPHTPEHTPSRPTVARRASVIPPLAGLSGYETPMNSRQVKFYRILNIFTPRNSIARVWGYKWMMFANHYRTRNNEKRGLIRSEKYGGKTNYKRNAYFVRQECHEMYKECVREREREKKVKMQIAVM